MKIFNSYFQGSEGEQVEQLNLFQPQMPAYEYLQYLADLLKMKSSSNNRQRFMEKILTVLKPKVREWEESFKTNTMQPYIEPVLLLFYADYAEWEGLKLEFGG